MMAIRLGLIFFFAALVLAMVADSSPSFDASFGVATRLSGEDDGLPTVGDLTGEDEEMMMDSESARRTLAYQRKRISYAAMRKDAIPCTKRGRSYYNMCVGHRKVNPYTRACVKITYCERSRR